MTKEKRQALKRLYAFCHEVDSIVDDGLPKEIAEERLKAWEILLLDVQSTQWPSFPRKRESRVTLTTSGFPIKTLGNDERWRNYVITEDIMKCVARFEIPKKHLLDIIEGVKLDLIKQRYATFADLQIYCYKVASAVGLASLAIFKVPEDEGREFAVDLGMALQLTNILRDVKEDAARGRIYMPAEDMKLFNVCDDDILGGIYSRRFVKLMRFEAARAKDFFEAAHKAMPAKYKSELMPALVMAAIYRRLLDKIEHNGFNVFNQRIRLSFFEKWHIRA